MEDQVHQEPHKATSGAVVDVSDDNVDGLSLPPDEDEDFYYDDADHGNDEDYVVNVSDTELGEVELAGVISEEENGYTVAHKAVKATGAAKGKKVSHSALVE